jgi:hypothetical protein
MPSASAAMAGLLSRRLSFEQATERISRNELVRREVLTILIVGIVLILMASFLPAPIAPAMIGKPDPAR